MALKHALLAGLALEPRSGYDLTQWFARAASHYWAASHASIYPTLAALEKEDLVVHATTPSARGPARKVYRVTPAGRAFLLDWVGTPAAAAEVRDEQLVKALCYGLLPPDQALAQLGEAKDRYATRLAQYQEIAGWLNSIDPGPDGLAPAARLGMLLTVSCGIRVAASYVAWCDEAAALIRAHAQRGPQKAEPPHG